mmetsp:Transcript_5942/g.8023  ORF Transcript_5942/g.8023 Transcript_5942/m.8023 type:complete len:496 (+) Transcript_5942:60-1547(+)
MTVDENAIVSVSSSLPQLGNVPSGAYAQKSIDEGSLLVPSMVMGRQEEDLEGTLPVPSGPEVAEVARKLGIDLVFDSDLLYIAEDLLLSALPDGWLRHKDENNKSYYHSPSTSTTQWSHPLEMYYRGLVFMRKEGDQLLEEKAQQNPPTPAECREMAKYFGINPHEEVFLMPIAKAAVNAPLPPEWEEFEDDDGEVHFVSKITKKTSEHHPLDGYFFELINQKRYELAGMQPPHYPMVEYHLLDTSFVPYPWMEFLDLKSLEPFWYNFIDNLTTYRHPCELVKDVIRTEAVLRLQAWARGNKVRAANRVLVENLAATSIQKIFRGCIRRKEMKAALLAAQNQAAAMIQALWRGNHQRRGNQVDKMNEAALLIQSIWRTKLAMRRIRAIQYIEVAIPVKLHLQSAAEQKELADEKNRSLVDYTNISAMNDMNTQLEERSEVLLDNMERVKILKDQDFDRAIEDTHIAPITTPSSNNREVRQKKKKMQKANSGSSKF